MAVSGEIFVLSGHNMAGSGGIGALPGILRQRFLVDLHYPDIKWLSLGALSHYPDMR